MTIKSDWHVYPATYTDHRGPERTCIFNDGTTLEMETRGVHFRGGDFDALAPAPETPPALLEKFTLNRGELCDCAIACEMPQVIGTPKRQYVGTLHVEVCLGRPAARGGIDKEILHLSITYCNWSFTSRNTEGLFEGPLLDLQKQMPEGHYLVNCFSCAYSDYFYGGQGLFGNMACFRTCKAEYLAVHTKDDFIAVWDKNAGPVQETGICPEFTRRRPNTGYRG